MKIFLLAICVSIVQSCLTSTPQKFSLLSKINQALDNARDNPTNSHPAKNLLKVADRACVNEKLTNDRQLKFEQLAFALSMVSLLCAPEEHHQKVFDYYAKNTIKTGLSTDCIEVKLKPLSNIFSILKNSNSSKTEAQCENEISEDDRTIFNAAKAMRKQSNFEGCDDEFYELSTFEDYLFKYFEVKPASEEEIEKTKMEFVEYYKNVTQRTVECIMKQ